MHLAKVSPQDLRNKTLNQIFSHASETSTEGRGWEIPPVSPTPAFNAYGAPTNNSLSCPPRNQCHLPAHSPEIHDEVPSAGKSPGFIESPSIDSRSTKSCSIKPFSTEPFCNRNLAWSACTGASFCPHRGQGSNPAAAPPPIRTVMPCRSTVTSVRTVRLVPRFDRSERKKLARCHSH